MSRKERKAAKASAPPEASPAPRGKDAKPNREQRRRNKKNSKPRAAAASVEASDVAKVASGPVNDISWYARFPELLTAAASLPFPYRPGMPDGVYMGMINNSAMFTRLPGVLALNWAPSIGKSAYASDPASLVAKQIYTQVRSVYSSELDADGPDFLVYLLCLDSIFSYIASLKRIYRLLSADNPFNYSVPEVVLGAVLGGSNSKNTRARLRRDRTKLYGAINELIYMLNRFRCPAIMDYFNRHYWMNDNIFGDAEDAAAQLYVFVQSHYYRYTLGQSTDATPALVGVAELEAAPTINGTTDDDPVGTLFNFGTSLIDALSDAGSSYTISGYLTRAFPDTPQFMVDILGADDKQDIVYSTEVLTQIENIRAVSSAIFNYPAATTVTQHVATNSVICPMEYTAETAPSAVQQYNADIRPFINLRAAAPTAAEVTIATRLHAVEQYVVNTGEKPTYTTKVIAGSDFVSGMRLYYAAPNSGTGMDTIASVAIASIVLSDSATTVSTLVSQLGALAMLEQFDWHPAVMIIDLTGSGQFNLFTDIHNVSSFEASTFKQINRVCLYSEFNSFAKT